MQNDREEPLIGRFAEEELQDAAEGVAADAGDNRSRVLLLAIVLVLTLGIAYFLLKDDIAPSSKPAITTPAAIAPNIPRPPEPQPAPDIPLQPAQSTGTTEVESREQNTIQAPTLTLAESDPVVKASLENAGTSPLYSGLLSNSDLLRRGAGVIDGMSRGLVLTKILPLPQPEGRFTTLEIGGQTVLDPASYQRYNPYARAVASLDMSVLASIFHQFRKLLEEAYEELGYKGDDFDNTLIRSLDHILATPEIKGDIALRKKEAMYLYSDPGLEALSPLQKQLMRMGPENVALVKGQALRLRLNLVGQ